jgi:hypothetical protein
MSEFTNTFGGSAVSPADVAYASYSFGANLTLFWPAFSAGNTNIAARFMNLSATANGLNVYLPDATLTSIGQDVIIFNAGADTFNVVSLNGNAIATIPSGQTYYIILNNNSTQDGTWQTVQFGVGTGSASAAALAGAGLIASAGLLNVNFDATLVSSSYSITMAARAILQVWTGGTGTITLPSAASVGDGFFFPIANNGSGNVTISASDNIDGAATSVFAQTQSGFIISTGTTWYTVGKGIQNTFAITLLNLNVAGNSDITETSAQAQNIIQQFTGVLTGNINVIMPATVQLYYVFNNTTGSFSLTVKTASGTGIAVAQGTHSILYCDGTNIVNAYTASVASTVSVSPGSANSPNINFVGNSNTGIYSPTTNQIALTAGGFEVMNFISAASSVNYIQSSASATGTAVSISALGSDANINLTLSPKGTGSVNISKAAITGGNIDSTIIGGTTAAAITGTTITANTGFTGNLTGNVTGNVTGNITGTAPAGTLTGTTLASNVVNSSLTGVGTITSGTWSGSFGAVSGANLTSLTAANISAGTAGINISGNAATVTTNANLTGAITSTGNATSLGSFTSAQLATAITDETGTGSAVFANAPTLVNPVVGTQLAADNSTKAASTAYVTSAVSALSGFVKTVKKQIFTTSGTYTPSTGMLYCIAEVLGGGGGGGGNNGAGGTAGGGGAGGYGRSLLTAATIGASKAVTIGAAGTGGTTFTGGTGGTSSLSTLISCTGGIGGLSVTSAFITAGGAGGSSSSADINVTGQSGGYGIYISGTGGTSGAGANSMYGSGGSAVIAAGVGQAGNGFGSGGSGQSASTGSSGGSGGAGAPGVVIITEYCSQ